MKLRITSGRVSESSKTKGRKYLPGRMKVDPGDPGHNADVSAASGNVKDVQKKLKKLRDTLEQVRECSKQRTQEISPERAREEQSNPDDEAAAPGDIHSDPECHRGKTNEQIVETNALRRNKGPRGHMGELERSRGVEGVRDRGTAVDGAEHDGIRPSSDGSEREVKTNAQSRRNTPGGHMGEPKASRDVEGDWRRRTDVEGVAYDWERREMDGATSGARRDSKRVETDPLAIEKEGQHE